MIWFSNNSRDCSFQPVGYKIGDSFCNWEIATELLKEETWIVSNNSALLIDILVYFHSILKTDWTPFSSMNIFYLFILDPNQPLQNEQLRFYTPFTKMEFQTCFLNKLWQPQTSQWYVWKFDLPITTVKAKYFNMT